MAENSNNNRRDVFSQFCDILSKNGSEIFWFVDDLYRNDTLNNNGAIFIFNPRTGQLFIKVIHRSVFAQQDNTRLDQLARWKTAESISSLVRHLPYEERPNRILVHESLMDPLRVHLLDFPKIVIEKRESKLALRLLANLSVFGRMIREANESMMFQFSVYDDWLRSISSYTAFSRLILILRALEVNNAEARTILKLGESNRDTIWPSFTGYEEECIKVEVSLRDIIVAAYGREKNIVIDVLMLAPIDIRNIVLGHEVDIP